MLQLALKNMLLAALLTSCAATSSHNLRQYSTLPDGCTVVDTFIIFSSSRHAAIEDLRARSFKALTTSRIDENLIDIDVPASGFVISNAEYEKYDKSLQARRKFEEENPGVIIDWMSTGYRVPATAQSFAGIFVACAESNITHYKGRHSGVVKLRS